MPDLLLYGDTERSAALRHEIPISIGDPFLYGEVGGRAYVMTSSLERDRIAAVRPEAALLEISDLGFHELLRSGMSRDQVFIELVSRAAEQIGVRDAIVDFDFPLGVAERLRADGIHSRCRTMRSPPGAAPKERRSWPGSAALRPRQKPGSRRQPRCCGPQRRSRERCSSTDEPLLAEDVRSAMRDACWQQGALLGPETIVASVWQGFGHEPGSGPLPEGLPIQIDLWPQDEASSCWADMTRTFLVGTPRSEEVLRQERLVRDALETARDAVRPGVTGERAARAVLRHLRGRGLPDAADRSRGGSRRGLSVLARPRRRACESTRSPDSGRRATRSSSPATCWQSNRGSGTGTSAASDSRICCSSPRTAARR